MSGENGFTVKKVAILGLGLMGGSLALALQKSALVEEIIGLDRNKENLDLALEKNAISWGTSDFTLGVRDADLLVLATPVGATGEVLKGLLPYLKEGCLITDVGSTKLKVVEEVQDFLPPHLFFVGGHPMAGSEKSGMAAAKAELFQEATYIFTPTEKTDPGALAVLEQLIGALGCQLVRMSPEEHDLAVASVSHLPHILAVSLVNLVEKLGQKNTQLYRLAAGGFRDTTRVASSHPVMWRDICQSNKEGILQTIEEFERILAETKKILTEENNQEILLEKLQQAKKFRESIPVCCQRRDHNGTCYSS